MPLFPRKKTFCTRLPIHVRLRRPDAAQEECASVTMSVITAEAYRTLGYDAEPEEPPCTISTAAGYHFVQDRMDTLECRLAGETGGIVADRIIVLDVLHPEVPVIDLIDLPGIVAVDVPGVTPAGKVDAVEQVISQQIDADRAHGLTSFYLVVVPCERPNTNGALKYIQSQGLLDRAIGVLTKADEMNRAEDLLAWIKGEDIENEDDDTVDTAAELGEVKLAKGWTATMLGMPKCTVMVDGKRVNYYTAHAAERLKKQEEAEKQYFGGESAKDVMRELYNQGLAGTGALAAKLTREYYEYTRGDWLQQTLARLLERELKLKSDRALLGGTDAETNDELAAQEVKGTLDIGAAMLSENFVFEKLLAKGSLIPSVEAALEQLNETTVPASELDATLSQLHETIAKHVAVAVDEVASFYADEMKKMLDAPVQLVEAFGYSGRDDDGDGKDGEELAEGPGVLSTRFWQAAGRRLVRSVFGERRDRPARSIDLHRQVLEQSIIPLGQYPGFTSAVTEVVRAECVVRRAKIARATAAVVGGLTADVSLYLVCEPSASLQEVTIRLVQGGEELPQPNFMDALKVAFIRHLPNAARLKAVVAEHPELKLSSFAEDGAAQRKRLEIDQRLSRVRTAVRGLVGALDVDESSPLDDAWLEALQAKHGLPKDARVLYNDEELATALANFETFHKLPAGSATHKQLLRSSARIGTWVKTSFPALEAAAATAATSVQSAARRRAAIKVKMALKAEREEYWGLNWGEEDEDADEDEDEGEDGI